MPRRNRCKHMDRSQQPAVIAVVGGWNDREMNVAALQAIRNAGATILDQLDENGGMLAPERGKKIGQHRFHMLGAAADPQRAGLAGSQRARTLAERFGVLQETTAASQQILAFGCQFDPAADAIEQRNPKLVLERLDLARSRRLAQAQLLLCGGKAACFANDDEGAQLSKVHFNAPIA